MNCPAPIVTQTMDPTLNQGDHIRQFIQSNGGSYVIQILIKDATDQNLGEKQVFEYVRINDTKQVMFMLNNSDSSDHITNSEGIDLMKLIDGKGNTVLHLAAVNNNAQMFHELVKYHKSNKDMQQWLGKPNTSGYQCMHIACFRGNLEIIQELNRLGCDLRVPTTAGMTCVHIVAQYDRPDILVYLYKSVQLNILQTDNKLSTALHQASFFAAEGCAFLLMSWGSDVNARDINGNTPLHLSVQSGSNRIVRRLLIYGADPKILDNDNKSPFDKAHEQKFEAIEKMLTDENKYSLGLFCGVHTKPKINKQSRTQILIFSILLFLNFAYQILYIITQDQIGYIILGCWLYLFLFFILICNVNPGYLESHRKNSEVLLNLMQDHINPSKICAECEAFKPLRSKHCDFCKRCVSVYDHHCPWINNCIGAKNHFMFIVFLLTLWLVMIILIGTFIVRCLQDIGHQDFVLGDYKIIDNIYLQQIFNEYLPDVDIPEMVFEFNESGFYIGIGLNFITFIFWCLLTALTYVQMRNISQNMTTYEKFTQPRASLKEKILNSSSEMSETLIHDKTPEEQGCFQNCLTMLCRNRHRKELRFNRSHHISLATTI